MLKTSLRQCFSINPLNAKVPNTQTHPQLFVAFSDLWEFLNLINYNIELFFTLRMGLFHEVRSTCTTTTNILQHTSLNAQDFLPLKKSTTYKILINFNSLTVNLWLERLSKNLFFSLFICLFVCLYLFIYIAKSVGLWLC